MDLEKSVCLAALLFSMCGRLPVQQIGFVQHPTKSALSRTAGITPGPRAAMWFTDWSSDINAQIGRITTAGQITDFPVPTGNSDPQSIVLGPDGALWFTEYFGSKIGRITTAGEVTEYTLPTANAGPAIITNGPDGALWFTEAYVNQIGRITTVGAITEFPAYLGDPVGITTGPDGALWFAAEDSQSIGRITTSGQVTAYRVPGANAQPVNITVGPDGALWYTDENSRIGRLTTTGVGTEYSLPDGGTPWGITVGPDGALWFTEQYQAKIGRITTAGTITEYPVANATPFDITTGADGSLWFTDDAQRIVQGVFTRALLSANPGTGVAGSQVTLAGSGFSPDENVNLYADSTSSHLLTSAVAGADGSFSVSIAAQQSLYGPHSVTGVGQTSGLVGIAPFWMNPSLVATPDHASPGSTIAIGGYGFGAGESVEVQWHATRSVIGTPVANNMGTFSQGSAIMFTIPAGTSPGPHAIAARGNSLFEKTTVSVNVE